MTVGPYGGQFAGDPYDPYEQQPQAATAVRPQIATSASTLVDGVPTVTFSPGPAAMWLVRRMVVQSDTEGQCLVYVGPVAPENIVSGTMTGDFDENDAAQPYYVPEGSSLTFRWPAGGACHARIEYAEVTG